MSLLINGAAVTHTGKVRRNNEDNYYLFGNYRDDVRAGQQHVAKTVLADQMLAAVYDGMGGEEAGEVASLLAARALMPCSLDEIREEAGRQVRDANGQVCAEMKRRGGGRMGTTLAALYLDKDCAVSCNVGDSRCYFMRDGKLKQLSLDHSEAQRMIDMGVMDSRQARESRSWHKLTQHLGIFPEEFIIEPYFSQTVQMEPGDIFMLCSDGLTDMVTDNEISDILGCLTDAETKAQTLVQKALDKGGRDNTTVIVLQAERVPAESEIRGGLKRKLSKAAWCALVFFVIAVVEAIIIA